ncbi:hypothetical protein Bca101_060036 [Brassica carinata]
MATPSEASALSFIKKHLLDESSPLPNVTTTNPWIALETSSDYLIFGLFDQTGFDFSEFETKPEITDLVTPRFTDASEFEPEAKAEIQLASNESFTFQLNHAVFQALKIEPPNRTEWIQFATGDPEPEQLPVHVAAEEKRHYRGVRMRARRKFAVEIRDPNRRRTFDTAISFPLEVGTWNPRAEVGHNKRKRDRRGRRSEGGCESAKDGGESRR